MFLQLLRITPISSSSPAAPSTCHVPLLHTRVHLNHPLWAASEKEAEGRCSTCTFEAPTCMLAYSIFPTHTSSLAVACSLRRSLLALVALAPWCCTTLTRSSGTCLQSVAGQSGSGIRLLSTLCRIVFHHTRPARWTISHPLQGRAEKRPIVLDPSPHMFASTSMQGRLAGDLVGLYGG
jgi:hypothetical protein